MPKPAITLFEYHNVNLKELGLNEGHQEALQEKFSHIENFLQEIWENRPSRPRAENFYTSEDAPQLDSKQKFISFMQHKIPAKIQAQNYVGVVHYEDWTINLLPKIFNVGEDHNNTPEYFIRSCYDHILWWLSYCHKIRFPNYKDALSSSKADFFEILIYLFSSYTSKILSELVYQCYMEVEDETSFMKGRLNTPAYIREHISTGRWHKFQCVYEEFTIDNTFNRIVKHVSYILFTHTKDAENKKNLSEILFLLDEVNDEPMTSEDCARIQFNIMYDELKTVLDYCKLFLDNCISYNYKDELQLFAFLLPMEKVFEDFIAGFMQRHLTKMTITTQKTDSLARINEKEKYQIKADLFVECGDGRQPIIADTKYKMVYLKEGTKDGTDTKIAQSDLYQMLAYATRFKVQDIKLLYPITLDEVGQSSNEPHANTITIIDEFSGTEIKITPYKLPIINEALMGLHVDNLINSKKTISEKFKATEIELKETLVGIFS